MDARDLDRADRGRSREVDERRQDARREVRDENGPDSPDDRADRAEQRRDNRRDYYDDRRDDRLDFARGVRYSSVWWTSNSCSQTAIVVVDGYTYYQCSGAWFGRTYYGGEVTYTVIDAPAGY
jgi:hypothetical protein